MKCKRIGRGFVTAIATAGNFRSFHGGWPAKRKDEKGDMYRSCTGKSQSQPRLGDSKRADAGQGFQASARCLLSTDFPGGSATQPTARNARVGSERAEASSFHSDAR